MTALDEQGRVACYFQCGRMIDPKSRDVYRLIYGWEIRGYRNQGGSDIYLRTPIDKYACPECIRLRKLGLDTRQERLA